MHDGIQIGVNVLPYRKLLLLEVILLGAQSAKQFAGRSTGQVIGNTKQAVAVADDLEAQLVGKPRLRSPGVDWVVSDRIGQHMPAIHLAFRVGEFQRGAKRDFCFGQFPHRILPVVVILPGCPHQ